jgi:hypothetical protein
VVYHPSSLPLPPFPLPPLQIFSPPTARPPPPKLPDPSRASPAVAVPSSHGFAASGSGEAASRKAELHWLGGTDGARVCVRVRAAASRRRPRRRMHMMRRLKSIASGRSSVSDPVRILLLSLSLYPYPR